jgi:hypothetical protein
MVYDTARRRVVLFGGTGTEGGTWEWDGRTWTERTPVNPPAARQNHAMAYDALRRRAVLFGGHTGGTASAETWEWDGSDWTLRTPVSSPSPRGGHAMAYELRAGGSCCSAALPAGRLTPGSGTARTGFW